MSSQPAGNQTPGEPCKPHEYSLTGPQVEPQAGYWMFCSKLHIPTIKELTTVTDNPGNKDYFPPYPDPCSSAGEAIIKKEIGELVELAKRRDDPCSLVGKAGGKLGLRKPISKLWNLMPPPLGAVLVNRYPDEQVIRTGRGLARAVEAETPGLFHRHALNYLISTRNWSAPRQALIWAGLDIAIATALQAAWYYKWLANTDPPNPSKRRDLTAYRERPIEYAKRNGIPLTVLFDKPDELNPNFNLCPSGKKDNNASGTPRHPAYPSGHSTYSAAASEFLIFFFGKQPTPDFLVPHPDLGSTPGTTLGDELENLADNIGLGRMWAGIHWRTDHENGQKLGRAVAHLIVQQLADMGIDLCPPEPKIPEDFNQCAGPFPPFKCNESAPPPKREQVEKDAKKFADDCGPKPYPKPCKVTVSGKAKQINRSVQRGSQ